MKPSILILGVLLITNIAFAEKRVALVIGNSNYKIAPLKNPANDATDIAQSLEKLGFTVDKQLNVNQKQMKKAINRFGRVLNQDGTIGLFYFAGHGIQTKNRNYLIPIGTDIESETDVEYEGIDAGRVLGRMEQAGNNLNLVIIDACRDNPFGGSFRSMARGLTRIPVPKGSMILYAASPGEQAADGSARNGVFTKNLLTKLQQPGLTVDQVFKQTAAAVYRETGQAQLPYREGSIIGEFYFKPVTNPPIATTPVNQPTSNNSNAEDLFIKYLDQNDPAQMQLYLKEYPNGKLAALFQLKLKQQSVQPELVDPLKTPAPVAAADMVTLTPKVIQVGKWAEGIAADGKWLWVAESGQRSIAKIDYAQGTITKRTKVGRLPVGMVSTLSGKIYTLVHTDKTIWRQSAWRGSKLTTLNECPESLATDGRKLWALTLPDCSSTSSRVIRVNANNGQQTQSPILSEWATALTTYKSQIWVAHARTPAISIVNQYSLQVESLNNDADDSFWAITASANKVFAGGRIKFDNKAGIVVMIDPAQKVELSRQNVSERIARMTSDASYVIAVGGKGTIWIFSTADLKLLRTITMNKGAFSPKDVLIHNDLLMISVGQYQGENGAIFLLDNWRPD